jgi:hypothetical protein
LVKGGVSKHLEGQGIEEKQDGAEKNGEKRCRHGGGDLLEALHDPCGLSKGGIKGVNVLQGLARCDDTGD